MKIDIVFLSDTKDNTIWEMNINCINSLIKSEKSELIGDIILVESNRTATFLYPDPVKVIVPDSLFNFNKYLNIGIRECKSEFVALCNNDIVFYENWFSEILKVKERCPEIKSFSPIDYDYVGTPKTKYPETEAYYLGYDIRTIITGWCIVIERSLFKKIGLLDEKFDFYYSDNDYSMTLRKYNIKHAMVPRAHVKHLGSINTERAGIKKQEFIINRKIPKTLSGNDSKWITENYKMLDGYFKFHDKWGSNFVLRQKRRIVARIPFLQNHFSRFIW